MKKMDLYYRLPIPAQDLLTSAEGWRLRRKRHGSEYFKYLNVLTRRDYSSRPQLVDLQNQELASLVQFAVRESPFYRNFYAGIDVSKVLSVEDLDALPVLEKETVRENLDDMYTIPRNRAFLSATSGTSGKSMTFRVTQRDVQRRLAYLDHFKAQHGFRHLTMRQASFNSAKIVPPHQRKPIYWRDNRASRQRIYSAYHCYGDNLQFYVRNLSAYQPHAIDGYPSAIYELARYMVDNKISLKTKPIAIFPTAEMLLPHHKATIKAAFGCPVLDQYASSEGAPFVTMCKFSTRHYCVDTGVIEDGGAEGILVTGFETHGTPLIRYRVGDRMTFADSDKRCECGSALPIVESIEGRGHDYLVAHNGRRVPAVFLSLVSQDFVSSIRAMQFVQDRIGELSVLLDVSDRYEASMETIIRDKLRYTFGAETLVNIRIVDHVERDASGKARLLINKIGETTAHVD